jgi:hypothetical protein
MYAGEIYEGCTMNGSVAYTHSYDSSGNTTGTINGVLNMTQCTTTPATYTITLSAGTVTTACTSGNSSGCSTGSTTFSVPLALSSKSVTGTGTLSGTEAFNQTANPPTDNLTTSLTATRSDGTHSTDACSYAASATVISCTESGTLQDGTIVNLTTSVTNAGVVTIGGSETLTDGVVLTYTNVSFNADKSGTMNFTMSNGYTGSFTFFAGGHGDGTILDNQGLLASSMEWTAAGAVTIEYSDYSTSTFNIS